jgi:hypothetical protein
MFLQKNTLKHRAALDILAAVSGNPRESVEIRSYPRPNVIDAAQLQLRPPRLLLVKQSP